MPPFISGLVSSNEFTKIESFTFTHAAVYNISQLNEAKTSCLSLCVIIFKCIYHSGSLFSIYMLKK